MEGGWRDHGKVSIVASMKQIVRKYLPDKNRSPTDSTHWSTDQNS
jgi:hypothetical protein